MLEVEVISHDEVTSPQICPPMVPSFYKADELTLIGWQLGVLWHDLGAEDCDGSMILVEHCAKAGVRCLAIYRKEHGEVWQLEN